MKKIRNIIVIGFAVFFLSACQEIFYGSENQAIRFRASAERNIGTKTLYSGEESDDGRERINWMSGDKVDVFMYYSYESNGILKDGWEYATYKVVDPINNPGKMDYISEGHLSGVDNGGVLRWKGDSRTKVSHYFYSVYPTRAAGRPDSAEDVTLTFNLPQNSDNMDYAYMAAAHNGAIQTTADAKHENAVDLDYYPMITTIYVTLINQTNSDKVVPVQLTSKQPLYGEYKANLSNGRFSTSDTAEEAVDNNNQSPSVTVSVAGKTNTNNSGLCYFCIRPRAYKSEDVSLWINGKEHKLDAELIPCHKYNITVTIKENGESEITDVGLQWAFYFLRVGKGYVKNEWWEGYQEIDGNFLWSTIPHFQEKWPERNEHPNRNDFNDWYNNTFKSLCDKVPNLTLAEVKEVIPDEWDALLGYLGTVTDFRIESSFKDIPMDLNEKDFNFLPNLQELTLLLNDQSRNESKNDSDSCGININFIEWDNLCKLKLSGNSLINLTIRNCDNLTTVDLSGLRADLAYNVTIDGCESLETVIDIPNNHNWKKKITNCNSAVNTQ